MKYKIQITEYLQRTIEIEADTPEEALSIAEYDYAHCSIILDYDDIAGYEINILEDKNNDSQQQLT